VPVISSDDDPANARRGLRVVEGMCSDWGIVPDERGGKTVWCAIAQGTTPADDASKRRRAADERAF
jgi:hypothetical protein